MADNPVAHIQDIELRLQRAIDDLYYAFEAYGPPGSLHGSRYRDVDAIFKDLTSAPRRLLDSKSLSYFAFAAMTTVGDVETYKHFVPRVLEHALLRHGYPGFDPEVIAGKLLYGGWSVWPEIEKRAVAKFLDLGWTRARRRHPDAEDASGWLRAIAMLDLDVARSLDGWLKDMAPDVAVQLACFLSNEADHIARGRGYWEDVDIAKRKVVGDWLSCDALQSALLEVIGDVAEEDQWHLDMMDEHIAILKQTDWR